MHTIHPTQTGARTASVGAVRAAMTLALGLLAGAAQAQLVPLAGHAYHQGQQANLVQTRIGWSDLGAPLSHGLSIEGRGLWPRWEGRVGVLLNRQADPIKDSYVFTQPSQAGLQVRSIHVLSDYYIKGGLRATAGVVRGDLGQAWWAGSGEQGGGLNLSVQRLDTLGNAGSPIGQQATSPYVGAGYSTPVSAKGAASAWRFNADLGIITVNSNNIERITQVLAGNMAMSEITRDLRLRPVIKVSVGYAF